MPLTAKQARFVEEYLVDLNATQAATRAGYSIRTAKEQGYELLSKPIVSEAIAAAQAQRAKRTQVDADWVMRRLREEVEADIADLYDANDSLKPVREWPVIWRTGLVTGVDVEELYEGYGKDRKHIGRVLKTRHSERIKRLELIGRHLGMFKDKLELTGSLALTPTIIVNGKPS